jgi:hypothetical protein
MDARNGGRHTGSPPTFIKVQPFLSIGVKEMFRKTGKLFFPALL